MAQVLKGACGGGEQMEIEAKRLQEGQTIDGVYMMRPFDDS